MRYALPSQLGSSAFFAAPLRAAAARMECELLAAQHAWMQGSACAYVGRKRASLNFGCLLVSYMPLARGLFFAVLALEVGVGSTEIIDVILS